MAAADDDFFGIKSLDSMPLPQFDQQRKAKVPKSAGRRRQSDGRAKEAAGDLFEAHFFPELSEKGEHKMDDGDDTQNFIEEQFFPRRVQQKQQQKIQHQTKMPLDSAPSEIGTKIVDSSFVSGTTAEDEEVFELVPEEINGLRQLWALIDPIWKFDRDELVEYMAKRVVYESEDIIALDKPYQMAFSSGPKDQPQLDRIFQDLKQRIAPKIDRLHIVSSLEKNCSGVIVFSKSREKQLELQAQLANDAFLFRYRCLCKGIPKVEKARISIPLIKVLRGSNFKLCPLIGKADERQELYHLNTDFRVVNECGRVHSSLLDVFERRGLAQVVRSHLYYGLNCPVVGDKKYVKAHLRTENVLDTAISSNTMAALSLRKNDIRKMPMFLHRAEVQIPWSKPSSDGTVSTFHTIRAEMPPFFEHALKKLHLFKK